ncbi:PTS system, ascorbate-specific IIB component [Facklamia miroungae]|uniref:PTS system, ascorbate-specific IIB component n=2 Tax=Facklamia miroungae TaxID=120956 RepID=A0A1G7UBL3_9LACT|nr:PTS system, ascorbate-specific IIB component [Facklamia miroungae]
MLINTVCGNGLGSSLILKINVDKILKEIGKTAEVEATDVGSAGSSGADLIVTTSQFKNNLQSINKEVIYVNNVMDKEDLKAQLVAYFENN